MTTYAQCMTVFGMRCTRTNVEEILMAARNKPAERKPRELVAGSFTDRLARLEIGECESTIREFNPRSTARPDDVSAMKRNLVSNVTPTVKRVTDRYPERRYEIETGVLATSANGLYSVCVVKRVA